MKRASYKEAITWLAVNDDTFWLIEDNSCLSVTAALVSDLFGVSEEKMTKDLIKECIFLGIHEKPKLLEALERFSSK
jgi:hypothetical protein